MTEQPPITESWGDGKYTLSYLVELTGAVVTCPVNRYHPDRKYLVDWVSVRTEWVHGQETDQTVLLGVRAELARERWSPRQGKLYLGQLREVPGWLADLITRASPRVER